MAQSTTQKKNTASYINLCKPTRQKQSLVGDFLPGYVSTLANPTLGKINENIIVIGFENGKIYFRCNTKEELLTKIAMRKKHMRMLVYYKKIVFNQEELDMCFKKDLWMMNDCNKQRAVEGYNDMMKIVYM